MAYADLLVSVPLDGANDWLYETAIDLATKFDAGVIGVAVRRPLHMVCLDYPVPAKVFEEDRKQIEKILATAEASFRQAAMGRVKRFDWRPRITGAELADQIAREGRSTDLLIVGTDKNLIKPDPTRQVDVRSLVMQSARPVLVVPREAAGRPFEHVLVAWKEAREAQRAIADSFPFLTAARQVSIVAIVAKEEFAEAKSQVAEIGLWLEHHAIKAQTMVVESHGTHAAKLESVAGELKADLIVAGAYGYARQRQWTLGGVTEDLLTRSRRCCLLSH